MEAVATSKLTTKSQATIPGKIRKHPGVKPGDSIAFELDENNKVFIRKATAIDFEFAQALEGSLSEWTSKNDEEAYCDLEINALRAGFKKKISNIEQEISNVDRNKRRPVEGFSLLRFSIPCSTSESALTSIFVVVI